MKATKASQQNRFLRIITIPIRALGKAKDFYVRGMTSFGAKVSYETTVMAMPASNYVATTLPKSFSVNSSKSEDDKENDLRELIRAASTRRGDDNIKNISNLYNLQQQMIKGMPPRSCSVGMGRIDEEKPCVFGEEYNMNIMKKDPQAFYPRSRSHAVNRKSVLYSLEN
ncbi:hypothetical protein ACH5RR_027138 [Cinchona calisaya]|uniref:Uncharacterized protein n=1 Tax=Cinchona calisaya TaxID=153742 RepID=A0ABD2Z6G5_9GENT